MSSGPKSSRNIMEKEIKIIQKEIEKLLDLLEIKATIDVTSHDEGYNVLLDAGDDNALLIGKHGNTLTSLEFVLMLIVTQKIGEYRRLTVEIGSYRQEREEYLSELSDKLKNEVIASGYEKTVRGLKPWERRFVHMHFQDDSEVMTESVGEDRDRTLVIKKK